MSGGRKKIKKKKMERILERERESGGEQMRKEGE